jgi:hypothetical protein
MVRSVVQWKNATILALPSTADMDPAVKIRGFGIAPAALFALCLV